MTVAVTDAGTQREALRRLAEMTQRAIIHPHVVKVARAITADCPARDDRCELEAIFAAVQRGDPRIKELRRGVRYVADPLVTDWFAGPHQLLKMCADGACAGDCDDQAALVAALAGAVGFPVGLRVWGPPGQRSQIGRMQGLRRAVGGSAFHGTASFPDPQYVHVYAVVGVPKRADGSLNRWLGMDTTVNNAHVGWEPSRGYFLTAVVQGG